MLTVKRSDLPYSEVTPKELYFKRRRFLAGLPGEVLGAGQLLRPARAGADAPILQHTFICAGAAGTLLSHAR